MDPATIATIVAAISTAATLTTEAAIHTSAVPSGERVGKITNQTPFTLVQSSAANRFGYWTDSPPHDVSGLPHIQNLFDAWKMELSQEISEEDRRNIRAKSKFSLLNNAEGILFAAWVKKIAKDLDNIPGSFRMKGANYGVEGVAVYKMKDRAPSPIFCFYIEGGELG